MNSWYRFYLVRNEIVVFISGAVCWGLFIGLGGIWIIESRVGLVLRCWRNYTVEEEEKDIGLYFLKIFFIEMFFVFFLGLKFVNDYSY